MVELILPGIASIGAEKVDSFLLIHSEKCLSIGDSRLFGLFETCFTKSL